MFDDPVPGGRPGEVEHATRQAEELAARGVHGVVLSWVDTAGVNRVKAVPVGGLASAVAWGVGMSPVFDTFLADDSLTSSEHLGGPDGDLRLVPDLYRLTVLAAQPGWAWAPVDRMTQDGAPWVACSRSLLRRLVRRAAAEGVTYRAAIEIEFALGRGDAPPGEFVPACDGPAYGMTRLVEQSDFCAAVLSALASQGVDVDQIHPEYAAGQYEISVGALDPVAAADRSVLVRATVRALAQRHGLRVSFSPAVVAGGVGNGGHVHLSSWLGGVNVHAGGSGPYGMTAAAESFVAGLVAGLPPLAAVTAPSPASYLRWQPSHWAGVFACWGHETRETAVRVVTGMVGSRNRAANVEVKCADLAANPYLLLAGLIGAGRDGVASGAALGPEVTGDPVRFDDAGLAEHGVRRLPSGLAEAVREFETSPLTKALYGEVLAGAIIAVRRAELARTAGWSPERVAEAYRWVY
ncbi:MAG TPA: glutamine synthetase family protein [Kineosporiaceae bacterium]